MAKRITGNRYKNCKECNKEFKCVNRSEIENKIFCSKKCIYPTLSKKLKESRRGKGNPMYGKTGWNKGMKMSKEHCDKLSKIRKENPNRYWLGKKRKPYSKEWRDNISKAMKGREIKWKDKLKIPKSEEHKKNISLAKMGNKNPMWRGGIYVDYSKSPAYKRWRYKVVKRDNRTCQKCGSKEKPHAHHKKGKKDFPELMLVLDNGITFCEKCHKVFHKIYGVCGFTLDDLNKFLKI